VVVSLPSSLPWLQPRGSAAGAFSVVGGSVTGAPPDQAAVVVLAMDEGGLVDDVLGVLLRGLAPRAQHRDDDAGSHRGVPAAGPAVAVVAPPASRDRHAAPWRRLISAASWALTQASSLSSA